MLKDQVIVEILHSIFQHVETKNEKDLYTIIAENSNKLGYSTGFSFNACYYGQFQPKANHKLHESLHEEMIILIRCIDILKLDKTLVSQNLYVLLKNSDNLKTITNAIPPYLFKLSSSLTLSNFEPNENYQVHHKKRTVEQYELMLPKIKMYLVSKFIL